MERYLKCNRVAAWADGLGVLALMYLGGTLWFTWLWGLSIPAVLAGASLGTLMWMARLCARRRSVARREKALRSRLGAELLMEELMLSDAQTAHRQAAELLRLRWPLKVEKVTGDGALCMLKEEKLLVMHLRMPPDGALSAGDLIAAQRAVRAAGADRGVLCVPGKATPAVLARAEEAVTPLRIIGKETLLALAGEKHPATDAQLIALGQRRRRQVRGGVLALVFRQDKARRYFTYGLAMTLMYLIMGVRVYAVAGLTCLTMAVMCCRSPCRQEL